MDVLAIQDAPCGRGESARGRSSWAAEWPRTACCASASRTDAASRGIRVVVPRPGLCTDNAAMIGAAGFFRARAGARAGSISPRNRRSSWLWRKPASRHRGPAPASSIESSRPCVYVTVGLPPVYVYDIYRCCTNIEGSTPAGPRAGMIGADPDSGSRRAAGVSPARSGEPDPAALHSRAGHRTVRSPRPGRCPWAEPGGNIAALGGAAFGRRGRGQSRWPRGRVPPIRP